MSYEGGRKKNNHKFRYIGMIGVNTSVTSQYRLTLFTERQSEITQIHPDSTFCDISIKKNDGGRCSDIIAVIPVFKELNYKKLCL